MREVFGITGIQTIGDRFGNLTPELPEAAKIGLNMESVNLLLPSAFTIAMLGAIESLLSATVADGRTGDRTNCNTGADRTRSGKCGGTDFRRNTCNRPH